MNGILELILAAFLLIDLWFAASSRLLHCINLASWHGLLVGILPLALWDWQTGFPGPWLCAVAVINILVKAIFLPRFLRHTMYQTKVKRELEPFIGYSASLLIVLAAAGLSFLFCVSYGIGADTKHPLACPTAFTTIMTGLFIIVSRRKAITQVIGFLIFENGITVFGLCMMVECGPVVELGILLDVFVLIFVMGIAVFQISREFSHIDADRLTLLRDESIEENKKENERMIRS